MGEALRLNRANESLGVGIQVGTSWRQPDRFHANGPVRLEMLILSLILEQTQYRTTPNICRNLSAI
jgi:hypothetical protein